MFILYVYTNPATWLELLIFFLAVHTSHPSPSFAPDVSSTSYFFSCWLIKSVGVYGIPANVYAIYWKTGTALHFIPYIMLRNKFWHIVKAVLTGNKTHTDIKSINETKIRLRISVNKSAVFTIAVQQRCRSGVQPHTRWPQVCRFAVTSNSSNIKHRHLLSVTGLHLHRNTYMQDTRASAHTQVCVFACARALSLVMQCACV